MQRAYNDNSDREGINRQLVEDTELIIKYLFITMLIIGLFIDILSYFNRKFAMLLLPVELLIMTLFQFTPR